jgi:hypothetical protein
MEETMTEPAIQEPQHFRFDPKTDEAYLHGERVTQAMIDAMADKALREGPPPGLIPGGKSLSGDGSHSPRFQVVLSAKSADKVRARAAAEDLMQNMHRARHATVPHGKRSSLNSHRTLRRLCDCHREVAVGLPDRISAGLRRRSGGGLGLGSV